MLQYCQCYYSHIHRKIQTKITPGGTRHAQRVGSGIFLVAPLPCPAVAARARRHGQTQPVPQSRPLDTAEHSSLGLVCYIAMFAIFGENILANSSTFLISHWQTWMISGIWYRLWSEKPQQLWMAHYFSTELFKTWKQGFVQGFVFSKFTWLVKAWQMRIFSKLRLFPNLFVLDKLEGLWWLKVRVANQDLWTIWVWHL